MPFVQIPILAVLLFAPLEPAALRHPHFPKTVTMSLGFGEEAPKISVSHLTATFDRDGFEKMPAGGAWHLANGKFECGTDLLVGEESVPEGRYRLLARKQVKGDWELVLDPAEGDFNATISDKAIVLKTRFLKQQPLSEHLRIDLQPAGDQQDTTLNLEVHFDTYAAVAAIEVDV